MENSEFLFVSGGSQPGKVAGKGFLFLFLLVTFRCSTPVSFWKVNWHWNHSLQKTGAAFKIFAVLFGPTACECLPTAGLGFGWWSTYSVSKSLTCWKESDPHTLADWGQTQNYTNSFIRSLLWVPSFLWSRWYFLIPSIGSRAKRNLALVTLCTSATIFCIQGQADREQREKNEGWFHPLGNTAVLER